MVVDAHDAVAGSSRWSAAHATTSVSTTAVSTSTPTGDETTATTDDPTSTRTDSTRLRPLIPIVQRRQVSEERIELSSRGGRRDAAIARTATVA